METGYIVDITQAPCIYYIHHYCAHWVAWRTGRIGKPVQSGAVSRATVTGERLILFRSRDYATVPKSNGKARWEALVARSQETCPMRYAHDPSRKRSELPRHRRPK